MRVREEIDDTECKVYILVLKDEFEEVIHKSRNKSAYKYAFTEMEDEYLLEKSIYTYTDNKEYYLYRLDILLEYCNICWERFLCISELLEQVSKYQMLIIKEDGTKYTKNTGFPYSKGFEYPPLKCPIEKSFKYLEKV